MDEPHLPGEARQKTPNHLGGNGDLRNKDEGLPAAPDGFGSRAQVDLGFARTGHTVKQEGFRLLGKRLKSRLDGIPGFLLVGCQFERGITILHSLFTVLDFS